MPSFRSPIVRSALRRIARLEEAQAKATEASQSLIVRWYGSMDAFEAEWQSGVDAGRLDGRDMPGVIAALRRWDTDGIWGTGR